MKQLLLIFLIALFATISCSAPSYYEKNHDEPEYVVIYSTSWCGWCKVAKDFFEKNNNCYNYIILLQPTSPLRASSHIDEAIELLDSKNADAIVSVCKVEHNPLWSNILPKDGSMKDFLHNDIKHQRGNTECGIYCLHFLETMLKGTDFEKHIQNKNMR